MSDMSNDRLPIPVEAGGTLPDDTEGHLAAMRETGQAPESDDTEGHLAPAWQQSGEASESDDTEGHLASLRQPDDNEGNFSH